LTTPNPESFDGFPATIYISVSAETGEPDVIAVDRDAPRSGDLFRPAERCLPAGISRSKLENLAG
jgi:hypothetical protein